jgi:hypothetical protein
LARTAGALLPTLTFAAHSTFLAVTARVLLTFAAHAATLLTFAALAVRTALAFSVFATGILFTIRIH